MDLRPNPAEAANWKGIFVFAEQREGKVQNVALELLTEARRLAADLGCEVSAVLCGEAGIKEQAGILFEYGAAQVYLIEHPELKHYRTAPYTLAVTQLIEKYRP